MSNISNMSDCYNNHGNQTDCEKSGSDGEVLCKYDESNDLCLKDCNNLKGEIQIEVSNDNSDLSDLSTSMKNLLDNVNDYADCLKDMNFFKYFRESLLSKDETTDLPVGVAISKNDINASFNDLKLPISTIDIPLYKIQPGDIWDGTGSDLIKEDVHINYESKTMSEIYTSCINDNNLQSKECCAMLKPADYSVDSATSSESNDDTNSQEGMISFTLDDSESLADNEFIKIDESGINEITNCYIDNITEVQRYKYFGDYGYYILYFFIFVGFIIVLRAIIWLVSGIMAQVKRTSTSPMVGDQ